MLAWTFLLLALRSYILAWKEKKNSALRILDAIFGTFSLALFLLLPSPFHGISFMVIAAVITYFLYRRFSEPRRFSFQSLIGWGLLYGLGALAAISYTFFHLMEDQKVAQVIFTGNGRSEWVSWKNPTQAKVEGAWLASHEVIIQNPQGKEICRQFIYGDLVGLRAEVMTIQWPLRFLGFSHLCRLETLYNGYSTASRHNLLPHLAASLPFSLPVLQSLWQKIYHHQWTLPGIKTASLESVYFPLTHEGSYWLVVGETGLTPLPNER